MQPRLNTNQIRRMHVMFKAGVSFNKIAKCFGVDPTAVTYQARKIGHVSPHCSYKNRLDYMQKLDIAELRRAGKTVTEIAAYTGLSENAVQRHVPTITTGQRRSVTRRRYPIEMKLDAVAMYQRGVSIKKISKQLGPCRRSIKTWIEQYG